MTTFDNWLASLPSGGRLDMPVQSRELGFSFQITYQDRDLSGATFAGSIKQNPGLTSAALASFTFSTPTLNSGDTTTTATISQAIINALPQPANVGDPIDLAFDIYVTPSGGAKELVFGGIFKVNPGVTQS